MALRDQPYIPLYIQDYLTDEKLNMCSAAAQGVYIKLMCLFHKSEKYGGVLLKQKDKQKTSNTLNFALKIAKLLPFDLQTISSAINELIDENVLIIDKDFLYQKRMVKDNELSIERAKSGKKGGEKTQKKYKDFALAKSKATSEVENEVENSNNNISEKFKNFILGFNSMTKRNFRGDIKTKRQFEARVKEGYTSQDFSKAVRNLYSDEYHMENAFKYATPEFITRADKLEMYLNKTKK